MQTPDAFHAFHAFLAEPPSGLAVTAAYDADLESDGYVNNLTRVWCWRPDVAESFQNVRNALVGESVLTEREVALLVVATAAARDDAYCGLAWGRNLAKLTDEATAADVLAGREAELSDREAALVRWAGKVVLDPNGTTAEDVAELRERGLGDREIFEATTWVAFRMAFSTVNGALGAAPDAGLVAKVPPQVRDAVTFGRPPQSS